MRRTIFVNLVDRMVQSGDVDQAEKLVGEAMLWATERQDRAMEAWLLFAGSRLDARRSDLYRARDRAKDALKLYASLEDKLKVAELQNHLAMIEFNDGNVNASMDHLRLAIEASDAPGVVANAEFTKGLIARRANKPNDAAENFKRANELAGNAGLAQLALEAGFFYGETLLVSGDFSKAADVLARVALPDHPARVQRAAVFELSAFDWNCPQHIPVRYNEEEVRAAVAPLHRRIAELEAENVRLRTTTAGRAGTG
jgi:tetratricopeptide (TPR) repeat protein